MPNLSKLDETIEQLEEQTEVLKQNNKVLSKVSELSKIIEKVADELSAGNENFDGTKKDIQESLRALNDSVENLGTKNEKFIDSLNTSNKRHLGEFEHTIASKLERFSSDIHVSIRQERAQLQEALQNTVTSHFNSLESKQKDLFSAQAKQILLLKILLLVIIGLCIGLGIKLFIG